MSNNETRNPWPPSKIMVLTGILMMILGFIVTFINNTVGCWILGLSSPMFIGGLAWGAWRWERWSETVIYEAPKLDELRAQALRDIARRS